MSKRHWLAGVALGLAACGGPLTSDLKGPTEAPAECQYPEAVERARAAQREYDDATKPSAKATREAIASYEQKRRTAEAAAQAERDAKDCEDRAREWSDLRAQWQSAEAASVSARNSYAQIGWTIAEIVALLATIAVGVWAIMRSSADSKRDFDLFKKEAEGARADAIEQSNKLERQLEIAEAQAVALKATADATERALEADRPWLVVQGVDVAVSDDKSVVQFGLRWVNMGRIPAINSRAGISSSLPFSEADVSPREPGSPPPLLANAVVVPNIPVATGMKSFSVADVRAAMSGERIIVLMSRAEYDSPNGGGPFHTELYYAVEISMPLADLLAGKLPPGGVGLRNITTFNSLK